MIVMSNQTSREFIRYLKELDEAAEVACVGKEFQKLIDTYKGECIKTDLFGHGSRTEWVNIALLCGSIRLRRQPMFETY